MGIFLASFLAVILSFIAVGLFMLLMNGLPKTIEYWLLVNRYNFTEPKRLLGLKKAFFESDLPLQTMESFKLGEWHYYHYSSSLVNFSENINFELLKYEQAIIWYWIRTHNKELSKKK